MTDDAGTVQGFLPSPQQFSRVRQGAGSPLTIDVSTSAPVAADVLAAAAARLADAWPVLRTRMRTVPGLAEPLQFVDDGPGDDPVLRITADGCRVRIAVREYCADIRSAPALVAGLAQAVAAEWGSGQVAAPPLDYMQFAEWQRAALQQEEAAAAEAWWRRQDLPRDVPALMREPPAELVAGGMRSEMITATLGREATTRLAAIADDLRVPLDDVLMAAWCHLLARWTGRDQVGFSTELGGRVFEETAHAVGAYASEVPAAMRVTPADRLADLVARVSEMRAVQRAHEDYAAMCAPGPGVGVVVYDWPAAAVHGTLSWRIDQIRRCGGPGQLWCSIWRDRDRLHVQADADAGRFDLASTEWFLRCFTTLLEGMASDPQRLPADLKMLPAQDAEQLVAGADPVADEAGAEASVVDLFDAQAARVPGEQAIEAGETSLTYAELAERVRQHARWLARSGVRRGDAVALATGRSAATVVWQLAIWRACAVMVPVDPADPEARAAYVRQDAKTVLLVDGSTTIDPEPAPDDPAELPRPTPAELPRPTPAEPAYVIYTSGTTGRPKGVVVSHGELSRYLHWASDSLLDGTPLPAVTAPTFDAALKQTVGPLLRGDPVWVLPDDIVLDPAKLHDALCSRPAVALNCVPSVWQRVLDCVATDPGQRLRHRLRRLMLGGDSVPPRLLARTAKLCPDTEVWNLYGPTEATANAAAGRLRASDTVTIGGPIAGRRLYVLDSRQQPVPPGVPGRLFIGGHGLALGYLSLPGRTAASFVPDPYGAPGSRMYDTGDLARRGRDGRIELLGRRDLQVKIRGYRVELEEIEATLRSAAGVRDVAAGVTGSPAELTCWVEPSGGPGLTVTVLRSHALATLPEHAVPSSFVEVDALPRTAAGKLDRPALARLTGRPVPLTYAGSARSPAPGIQSELATMWRRILGVNSVGPDDSFFALGGHSLLAIKLIADTRERFGVALPARAILSAPTLAGFAATVAAARAGE
jgi:amino acid adenylation domain-containing protein